MIPSGKSFDFCLPTHLSPGLAELANRNLNELFLRARLPAAELEIRPSGIFSSDMPELFRENLASLPRWLTAPQDRERAIRVLTTAISLFAEKDRDIQLLSGDKIRAVQPLITALEALKDLPKKSCHENGQQKKNALVESDRVGPSIDRHPEKSNTGADKFTGAKSNWDLWHWSPDQDHLDDEYGINSRIDRLLGTGRSLGLDGPQNNFYTSRMEPFPYRSDRDQVRTPLDKIAGIRCEEDIAVPDRFSTCMQQINALPQFKQIEALCALVAQVHVLPRGAVPAAFVACVTQVDRLPLKDHERAFAALMDEIVSLPNDLLPAVFEALMAPVRGLPAEELTKFFRIIPYLPVKALPAAFAVCVKQIGLLAADTQDEALPAFIAATEFLELEWQHKAKKLIQAELKKP